MALRSCLQHPKRLSLVVRLRSQKKTINRILKALKRTATSQNILLVLLLRSRHAYSMLSSFHSRHLCDSDEQENSSTKEHNSAEYYYRPSGQGDVFLFSPGVSSMPSNGSISSSSSSSSFDTLSYSFSPTDVGAPPKLFSPPSLPSAVRSGSPLFVEAYLSGSQPKPIARMSPSTPFEELFNSSPAGYWQAGDLSVSPISRHSSVLPVEDACEVDSEDGAVDAGKLKSLLEYASTQDILDTPRSHRASSPCSLSSLSSAPSSPSALFSGVPASSSQTSRGRTPSCSPARRAQAHSSLGSPFKMHSEINTDSRRRSRRAIPVQRTTRRSLAAEILNQLGGSRLRTALVGPSSPSKRSSSPLPALSDSDDENYEPGTHVKTRKRSRPSTQDRPALRKKRRTSSTTSAAPAPAPASELVNASEDQESNEPTITYPNRTFPLRIPVHDNFPLFYRRFPVSSVIDVDLAAYAVSVICL